jgi:hypothetical protein
VSDDAAVWRFRRSVARVDAAVEPILADYATSYCLRPVRRREVPPSPVDANPGVTWSIDGDTIVEFRYDERGPDRLVVHDIALVVPLKRRLRSRRVKVAHVSSVGAS